MGNWPANKLILLLLLILIGGLTAGAANAPEFTYAPPQQVVYWMPPAGFGVVAGQWEPPPEYSAPAASWSPPAGYEKGQPWAPPRGWEEGPTEWDTAPQWQ
jgi:hypothetical protein